jgi:hypothetical protein
MNQESNPQTRIPDHQFGFRRAHSTVQQSHRIANTTSYALTSCTATLLDIAQAFDKLWHSGLLYKIKKKSFHRIITIYLSHTYLTKTEDSIEIGYEI